MDKVSEQVASVAGEGASVLADGQQPKGQVLIPLERAMTPLQAAQTLTAYLLGDRAADNRNRKHGPFENQHGKWQLDGSNDYWLHEAGEHSVLLICRYPWQAPVVRAMAALFACKAGR